MINSISFGRTNPVTLENRRRTKSSLHLAENVLQEMQNSFGRPKSSSYLNLKSNNLPFNIKNAPLKAKLKNKAELHRNVILAQPYSCIDKKIPTGEHQSVYGDCGECAKAVQSYFFYGKDNTPSLNIVMSIKRPNNVYSNHVFNITNYDKDIDVRNPKTWGKQAVVTDLWAGIALKTEEAIENIHRTFNCNPFVDSISYRYMPDSISSLQTKFLADIGVDTNDSSVMYDPAEKYKQFIKGNKQ